MSLERYNKIVGSLSAEFAETELSIHQYFPFAIRKMNEMYELPINIAPTLDGLNESPLTRMQGFMKTLQKEMNEGQEILTLLQIRENAISKDETGLLCTYPYLVDRLSSPGGYSEEDASKLARTVANILDFAGDDVHGLEPLAVFDRVILVMLADWLNDMTVYNRSEALKFGIPSESVLACIMGSNFTKLGADGLPIKDENGKFQKGPNFIPPEEAIYATMFGAEELANEAYSLVEASNNVQAVALPFLEDPMAEIFYALDDEAEYDLDDEDEEDDVGY